MVLPYVFSYHSLCCEKTRLGNPEVRKVVDQSIQEYLTEYLELHPDVLDSVLSKALNAFKVIISFSSLQFCILNPIALDRNVNQKLPCEFIV